MPIKRRTYAGLPTTFGLEWGMPISLTGDVGGIYGRPDGSSPDEPRGLLCYFPGYGGDATEILSRLGANAFRAVHRAEGYHILSINGYFTIGDLIRTFNGSRRFLPQNNNYAWASGVTLVRGKRRTSDGKHWVVMNGGGVTSVAPTGFADITTADGIQWRPIAPGIGDDTLPDVQRIGGIARVLGGISQPRGVVREFLATCGCNIDRTKIKMAAYSTGDALGQALLRNHADLFTGLVGIAGAGPYDNTEPNWAAPVEKRQNIHFHGPLDVTVNPNGYPPGPSSAGPSSANHPSSVKTIEDFIVDSGGDPIVPPATTLLFDNNVGNRFTFQTAGDSTEFAPATDPVDSGGYTVKRRLIVPNAMTHIPTITGEGHALVSDYLDAPGVAV